MVSARVRTTLALTMKRYCFGFSMLNLKFSVFTTVHLAVNGFGNTGLHRKNRVGNLPHRAVSFGLFACLMQGSRRFYVLANQPWPSTKTSTPILPKRLQAPVSVITHLCGTSSCRIPNPPSRRPCSFQAIDRSGTKHISHCVCSDDMCTPKHHESSFASLFVLPFRSRS